MTVPGEILTPFNIAQTILKFRFHFVDERDVQLAIEEILRRSCIRHQREFILTRADRLDFLVDARQAAPAQCAACAGLCSGKTGAGEKCPCACNPRNASGIAIEVKVKGQVAEVLRQLRRYANHERIQGLVLVTTRRLHAASMPAEMNGKPLAVAMIGGL